MDEFRKKGKLNRSLSLGPARRQQIVVTRATLSDDEDQGCNEDTVYGTLAARHSRAQLCLTDSSAEFEAHQSHLVRAFSQKSKIPLSLRTGGDKEDTECHSDTEYGLGTVRDRSLSDIALSDTAEEPHLSTDLQLYHQSDATKRQTTGTDEPPSSQSSDSDSQNPGTTSTSDSNNEGKTPENTTTETLPNSVECDSSLVLADRRFSSLWYPSEPCRTDNTKETCAIKTTTTQASEKTQNIHSALKKKGEPATPCRNNSIRWATFVDRKKHASSSESESNEEPIYESGSNDASVQCNGAGETKTATVRDNEASVCETVSAFTQRAYEELVYHLENSYRDSRNQIGELSQKYEKILDDNNDSMQIVANYMKQISQLRKDNEKLSRKYGDATHEFSDRWSVMLKQHLTTVAEIQNRLKNTQQIISEKVEYIGHTEQLLSRCSAEKDEMKLSLARLDTEKEHLSHENKNLTEKVTEYEVLVKTFEVRLTAKDHDIDVKNRENDKCRKDLSDREVQLKHAKKTLAKIKSQDNLFSHERSTFESKIVKLLEENEFLEEAVETLQKALADVCEELDDNQAKYESRQLQMNDQHYTSLDENHRINTLNAQLMKQIDSLQSKLNITQSERDESLSSSGNIQSDLEEKKSYINQLMQEKSDAVAEKDKTTILWKMAVSELETFSDKHNKTLRELEAMKQQCINFENDKSNLLSKHSDSRGQEYEVEHARAELERVTDSLKETEIELHDSESKRCCLEVEIRNLQQTVEELSKESNTDSTHDKNISSTIIDHTDECEDCGRLETECNYWMGKCKNLSKLNATLKADLEKTRSISYTFLPDPRNNSSNLLTTTSTILEESQEIRADAQSSVPYLQQRNMESNSSVHQSDTANTQHAETVHTQLADCYDELRQLKNDNQHLNEHLQFLDEKVIRLVDERSLMEQQWKIDAEEFSVALKAKETQVTELEEKLELAREQGMTAGEDDHDQPRAQDSGISKLHQVQSSCSEYIFFDENTHPCQLKTEIVRLQAENRHLQLKLENIEEKCRRIMSERTTMQEMWRFESDEFSESIRMKSEEILRLKAGNKDIRQTVSCPMTPRNNHGVPPTPANTPVSSECDDRALNVSSTQSMEKLENICAEFENIKTCVSNMLSSLTEQLNSNVAANAENYVQEPEGSNVIDKIELIGRLTKELLLKIDDVSSEHNKCSHEISELRKSIENLTQKVEIECGQKEEMRIKYDEIFQLLNNTSKECEEQKPRDEPVRTVGFKSTQTETRAHRTRHSKTDEQKKCEEMKLITYQNLVTQVKQQIALLRRFRKTKCKDVSHDGLVMGELMHTNVRLRSDLQRQSDYIDELNQQIDFLLPELSTTQHHAMTCDNAPNSLIGAGGRLVGAQRQNLMCVDQVCSHMKEVGEGIPEKWMEENTMEAVPSTFSSYHSIVSSSDKDESTTQGGPMVAEDVDIETVNYSETLARYY